MKKIKNRCLKTYNIILAACLALLGFTSSCDIQPVYGAPSVQPEYGAPSAKFIVKGQVESAENNEAIENIQVVLQYDTKRTDEDGHYQVSDIEGEPGDQTYLIQFQDIDNIDNGEFENLDTIVEFIDPEFTDGDGGFYAGETEIELNVKLNPK